MHAGMNFKVKHLKRRKLWLKLSRTTAMKCIRSTHCNDKPPQWSFLHRLTQKVGNESVVNRVTQKDSVCSITCSAAVTNPLSNTPTEFINFQLEIQTPKERNWHLKRSPVLSNGNAERYEKSDDMRAGEVFYRS